MRAWWPLLWLLPTMAGTTAIAWRLAGREAAMVALLLALAGVPAYQQFTPGRIDHHNVQIALGDADSRRDRLVEPQALVRGAAGLLTASRSPSVSKACPISRSAARCWRCVTWPIRTWPMCGPAWRSANTVWRWRLPLELCVPGQRRADAVDHLSLRRHRAQQRHGHDRRRPDARAGGLARARGRPDALLRGGRGRRARRRGVPDVRCPRVRGPFAMVDPAIWPVWHDHVRELQPLVAVFRINPLDRRRRLPGSRRWRSSRMLKLATEAKLRRDFGFLAAGLVFAAAAITMVLAIRGYSYAIWLGMPLVAMRWRCGFSRRCISSASCRGSPPA